MTWPPALGVSPSLIYQVETGRASPSVSTLYAIANELDVSLDDLLFDGRRAGDARRAWSPFHRSTGGGTRGPARHPATRSRLASGVIWERLTTSSEPGIDFLYVTYEVGGASSPRDASSATTATSGAMSSAARSR